MPKPGVMLYFNMRPSRRLPDRERLQLYDAILDYSQTGTVPELSGASAIIWEYIQPTLEADNARYEATKEKRAKAGALGGMARGKNEKQSEANQANAWGAICEEANQANTIQYRTIQYSTIQFRSGGHGGQAACTSEIFSARYSGGTGLLRGKGVHPGSGAVCGLLYLHWLESGQESHEGLEGRPAELGQKRSTTACSTGG